MSSSGDPLPAPPVAQAPRRITQTQERTSFRPDRFPPPFPVSHRLQDEERTSYGASTTDSPIKPTTDSAIRLAISCWMGWRSFLS
jgi:hypothetical protein